MCLTHHLWSDLSARLRQFLDEISLADLVSREDIQRVSSRQDHCVSKVRSTVSALERII